jgi:hypothetical protein
MGKGFRELQVWQRSKDLAVYIYKVTNTKGFVIPACPESFFIV